MRWNVTLIVLVFSISFLSVEQKKEPESEKKGHIEKEQKKGNVSDLEKAQKFMAKVNKVQLEKMHEQNLAAFNHSTNLTDANKKIKVIIMLKNVYKFYR